MSAAPKVLFYDVETAPILGYVWGLWENNVALNQVKGDWHLLSWSAKWQGSPKVYYEDQRGAKNIEDDRKLLKGIWRMLDEADIVVAQNGNSFDHKKLNARFILNGMQPPSTYKQIDTCILAKKHFKFTSNKLEYLSDKLCTQYKKLKHTAFQGFDLWKACLDGNLSAWKEMERYNRQDVLALEELYGKLIPWDSSVNFNLYAPGGPPKCKCKSTKFTKRGFFYTSVGKYQRYRCDGCGAETRDRVNLLTKEEKRGLRTGTVR